MISTSEIKVMFVDDEQAALNGLKQKVKKLFPDVVSIGEFQNPKKALLALEKQMPDLLFLDIEMPKINGFELLQNVSKLTSEVIFVTAYNQYGIEALKANASDYILKPVDTNELKQAVDKALEIIESKQDGAVNEKLTKLLKQTLSQNKKLVIPTQKGMSFVAQSAILRIEGYQGYTKIHLTDGKELVSSYNLGKYESLLVDTFFKCHKSHIVNLELVKGFENEGYVLMENDVRIPISKANRKAFLNLFS